MGALFRFLEKEGIRHPRLPQIHLADKILEIVDNEPDSGFHRMVERLEQLYAGMADHQRLVAVKATNRHGSVSLAMVLALGRCSAKAYARSVIGAQGLSTVLGYPRREARQARERTSADAELFERYLRLSKTV